MPCYLRIRMVEHGALVEVVAVGCHAPVVAAAHLGEYRNGHPAYVEMLLA